ncbi:MAG: Helix-turn-helix domain [Firmicutes bacterium]|nr:Helix-turn-helix domain [Bacillota bacterium]
MNNIEIGKRIKEIRLNHGITSVHICRVLDKPRGWLPRRENGKASIALHDLFLIANALRVPGDVFFKGQGSAK